MALSFTLKRATTFLLFGLVALSMYALDVVPWLQGAWKHGQWNGLSRDLEQQLLGAVHIFATYPAISVPSDVRNATVLAPSALGLNEAISPAEWRSRCLMAQTQYPIVVFSKTYCPYSQRAKRLLESFKITPKPLIIEADLRSDTRELTYILKRLTGQATFPNVIVMGKSLGGSDDVYRLHSEGKLKDILLNAGVALGANGLTLEHSI